MKRLTFLKSIFGAIPALAAFKSRYEIRNCPKCGRRGSCTGGFANLDVHECGKCRVMYIGKIKEGW